VTKFGINIIDACLISFFSVKKKKKKTAIMQMQRKITVLGGI